MAFKTGVSILFGSNKQLGMFGGSGATGSGWKEGSWVRSDSKLATREHLCPSPYKVFLQPGVMEQALGAGGLLLSGRAGAKAFLP